MRDEAATQRNEEKLLPQNMDAETGVLGSIPLSTFRAKVEFGFTEAWTAQGHIGIKVWINNGDYLTEEATNAANAQTGQVSKKPARHGKR
jgi:small subunit ribosomal protein S3